VAAKEMNKASEEALIAAMTIREVRSRAENIVQGKEEAKRSLSPQMKRFRREREASQRRAASEHFLRSRQETPERKIYYLPTARRSSTPIERRFRLNCQRHHESSPHLEVDHEPLPTSGFASRPSWPMAAGAEEAATRTDRPWMSLAVAPQLLASPASEAPTVAPPSRSSISADSQRSSEPWAGWEADDGCSPGAASSSSPPQHHSDKRLPNYTKSTTSFSKKAQNQSRARPEQPASPELPRTETSASSSRQDAAAAHLLQCRQAIQARNEKAAALQLAKGQRIKSQPKTRACTYHGEAKVDSGVLPIGERAALKVLLARNAAGDREQLSSDLPPELPWRATGYVSDRSAIKLAKQVITARAKATASGASSNCRRPALKSTQAQLGSVSSGQSSPQSDSLSAPVSARGGAKPRSPFQ